MSEKTETTTLIAINRERGLVSLDDGSVLKMQNYVDRFGDDVDSAEEAISAIAELPNGRWIVIDLTEFEHVVRN